ncbi:hypothetical protein CerSpe_161680 [Prunus speciosa]
MAKAYDRVEWPFVELMMRRLGFDSIFRGWVMECISTVTYSVIVNGEATGHITPSRGLRQGDPLSPFLFLLCAEGQSTSDFTLRGLAFHICSSLMTPLFFAKLMNRRLHA